MTLTRLQKLLLTVLLVLSPGALLGQQSNPIANLIRSGATDPATCNPGPSATSIFVNTTSHLEKFCSATNTWTALANSGASSVSITGTAPIVVTPSPTTGTGVVSFAGTDINSSGNVVTTHLSSALPVNQGGTGTTTPALVAGTNITSITGTWPNQTINASGGGTAPTTVSVTAAAELDVPSCITVSNRDYRIRVSQLTMTAGASVNLFLQFSSDNGATYDTATHYFYGRNLVQLNGATGVQQGNSSGAGFQPTGLSADVYASGEIYSFSVDMFFPMNTTAFKLMNYQTIIGKAAGSYSSTGAILYTGTSAVNAFRILASGAGTFTATVTCQPLP